MAGKHTKPDHGEAGDFFSKVLADMDREASGSHRGVDPQLIPYIEAADKPDSGDGSDYHRMIAQLDADEDTKVALRNIVEHSLLSGPLPEILDELDTDDANESSDTDRGDPTVELAAHHELSEQVREVYEAIIARAPEHRFTPTLDRIQRMMDYLGDPQLSYETVHVAGTNGKTSIARMVDALARSAGLRTGRFTSPHLERVNERISIDGQPLTDEEFLCAWQDVHQIIDLVDQESVDSGGPRMSFFEVLTAMAFAAFADAPVNLAVIEVGMGGSWDSTNVLNAKVSVIAPISMDHTQWLGDTIEKIAVEKAGIIHEGGMVVIGAQRPEVERVIHNRAVEMNATVLTYGSDFYVTDTEPAPGGQLVSIQTPHGHYQNLFMPLLGEHQAQNAAVALTAFEAYLGGKQVEELLVERAFTEFTSPGRLEVTRTSPTVILDGAHNVGAAEVLRRAVLEQLPYRHVVGVYSAMRDKDVEGVLGLMEPALDAVVLVDMNSERGMEMEKLTEIANDVFGEDRVYIADDPLEAIDRAVSLAEQAAEMPLEAATLVFGSLAFVGEVRALMHRGLKR
ncbi:MAG: folylpolyglutamate synthase/dihydrofolate synthase family protein [Varibaculum sp.]|nr:folylpolyglutamate synthase/dihydrofolate synthase family protein [Varibaculum sp.]